MAGIAEPLPVTLLSLHRFARLLGVNPVHFWGAVGPAAAFPMNDNRCNDVWPHYSWQFADSVSHYALALAISDAEDAIANELGWYPAPKWIYQEIHKADRYYRRDAWRRYARNVRGDRNSVRTRFVKIISPGRRAASLISQATTAAGTLTYSDEDGDGFFETATVAVATSLTNVNEIRVFHADKDGDPGWRIREPRSKAIASGVFTAVFDSWLFIDPERLARYPSSNGFEAIDLSTVDPLVTEVDVYRIYNDTSQAASQFLWEPEPSPTYAFLTDLTTETAGELSTQDGTLHVRDAERGIVVPEPATYSSTTGDWTQSAYTESRDPDMIKIWYYAGELSNGYLSGRLADPLPQKWALAIAQLTVARLEREMCSCGNLKALSEKWQTDAAVVTDALRVPDTDLNNPFGTRYGEILAWRTVRRERRRIRGGGAI